MMENHGQFEAYAHELKRVKSENYTQILKYAKKIIRLLKTENHKQDLKVAVLSYGSCQYFVQAVYALFCKNNLRCEIYEGQFNGIKMDALDGVSDFYSFRPDFVIILSDYREFKILPEYLESQDQVEEKIEAAYRELNSIWNRIHEQLPGALILQSNIVSPIVNALGNLAINVPYSMGYYFDGLNRMLTQGHPNYVTIVGMDELSNYVGKKYWFDDAAYSLNKTTFSLQYVGLVAELFVRLIVTVRGKVRKCLVLDLDNTLWGGIVSEEGADGVKLDINDAVGETYNSFQNYIKALKDRGIILAVCSKNDRQVAEQPFRENPSMVLKLGDFAAFHANWEDKASNIRAIANELNIGLDSLVFFDDNPAEREIVNQMLPEVFVVDVPEDSALYTRVLCESGVFECVQLTREDLNRAESYNADGKREQLLAACGDYQQYLKSLSMQAAIQPITEKTFQRFVQLVNKTNQFNLRTKRYSDAEVQALCDSADAKLFTVQLKDKFSDYGIISCVILRKDGENCLVDTFVMSCRVLKRGVEYIVSREIIKLAKGMGCKKIIGEYIPTAKNNMVRGVYRDLGYSCDESLGEGIFTYQVDAGCPNYETYIEVL